MAAVASGGMAPFKYLADVFKLFFCFLENCQKLTMVCSSFEKINNY